MLSETLNTLAACFHMHCFMRSSCMHRSLTHPLKLQHIFHPITINSFQPAPMRAYARRQLELMRQGMTKRQARDFLDREETE